MTRRNKYRQREVDTGGPFYLSFAPLLTGWGSTGMGQAVQ